MKGLKQTTVWEILNHIQDRMRTNVSRINHNKDKIEEFRQRVIEKNIDASEHIQPLQLENDELSSENTDLINLHYKILSLSDEFMNLKGVETFNNPPVEKMPVSEDEFITMVIGKQINIDEENPYLHNDKVIETVYKALIEQERYEECSVIMRLKELRKNQL